MTLCTITIYYLAFQLQFTMVPKKNTQPFHIVMELDVTGSMMEADSAHGTMGILVPLHSAIQHINKC